MDNLKQYIPVQKKKAQQLKMNWIKDVVLSPLKNKKYRIIFNDGTHVDYGHKNYEDFLQHNDEKRRERFWKRWRNNPNINNIRSPVYYLRLNW